MNASKKKGRVLSVKDVSRMCQVSNESIRRWIRKFGLNAYNVTNGLTIKILESDLRAFSEKMKIYVDWDYLDE